ncbi:CYFA0S13e02740g1_1 [Cyberlindnera fabianii]|uniref:CYFA0S13e02740g1_1 n=1 Tax=Cyberlindnera fabianii TaxID=36022 RepID=A0A061B2D9_CYBFA|nr:CYFA0S13e02740g1_1 [Cyberlindnera fabianii]
MPYFSVESNDSAFRESSKTVALTIDEVNDNPDELIELRGEGRYFGASDGPTGQICSNCHQRGHRRAQCKTVVCHSCGVVGDHYEQQCPKSMVCANCGERGHFKNQCKERIKRIYCQSCTSTRHTTDRCPGIWRSYLTKEDDRRTGLPNNIYCYNCAEKGHYGDECTAERSSRYPNIDGSAFSGHNLPRQMRERYFNMHKKRRHDDSDDDLDYDEDYRRDDPKPKKSGFLGKIKDTFKSKKNKKRELRPTQSMPQLNNSGTLPPRGQSQRAPSVYNYPRGGQSYGDSYSPQSNYNNGGYNDNYNRGGYNNNDSYNRSGYIQPSRGSGNNSGNGGYGGKKSGSGSFGSRFSKKRKF